MWKSLILFENIFFTHSEIINWDKSNRKEFSGAALSTDNAIDEVSKKKFLWSNINSLAYFCIF